MPTIRMLRERNGWTQAELADKIGAHVNTVARWEQGGLMPGTRSLRLLSIIFSVTLDELTASEPAEKQKRGRPRKDDPPPPAQPRTEREEGE